MSIIKLMNLLVFQKRLTEIQGDLVRLQKSVGSQFFLNILHFRSFEFVKHIFKILSVT